MTSRELVKKAINFEGPERLPRHVWILPWAEKHIPEAVQTIQREYPNDIVNTGNIYAPNNVEEGDPYAEGEYIDPWGCVFENVQPGVIGEVKRPLLEDPENIRAFSPPYEVLPEDESRAVDQVNRFCASTDKFVLPAGFPRPWERYQFLRGTQNAMMDVMMPDANVERLFTMIRDYYLKELEFWAKTDVDGIFFMDDWGTQDQLLIPPDIWKERFQPLYREYCELAHANDKFAFMHSDGCIAEIYDELVHCGVDVINSQVFCMDMDWLASNVKGRVTFWGEMDRQHVLPAQEPGVGRAAVKQLVDKLYDPEGGMILQFEIGPGTCADTALAVIDEWEQLTSGTSN